MTLKVKNIDRNKILNKYKNKKKNNHYRFTIDQGLKWIQFLFYKVNVIK